MEQLSRTALFIDHEVEGDRHSEAGYLAKALDSYQRALALNADADWIQSKIDRLTANAPDCVPGDEVQCLNLFVPFYTPPDKERAKEILYCLEKNLATKLFASIVLLVDDDTDIPYEGQELSIIRLDHRPTYLDWVNESRLRCPGQVSILANSDIYFDDSIARLLELFRANPSAFVALSRLEKGDEGLTAHPNPHFSQDTWAFLPDRSVDFPSQRALNIPIGVPRCDNKIAYVFATEGYEVYNPYPIVRSMHVHQTNLRYYNKRADRRILGGVAMVHPGQSLFEPSRLDLQVWSIQSKHFNGVKLNRSLESWAKAEAKAAEPRPLWLAHDEDWQYPAETERQAFYKMREALGDEEHLTSAIYLGFPFATLIDLRLNLGKEHPRTKALSNALYNLRSELRAYERVVTVSQHIRTRECADLFSEAGVTDLYWSHCVKGQTNFPGYLDTQIHPFPLYPVQQLVRDEADFDRQRMYLFSFVGARGAGNYLTETRNHIIDLLSTDPRGLVVSRDNWHYNKTVYDAQILGRVAEDSKGIVNEDRSAEFRRIMDESVFSLCPSGTGPNSIRLWESLLNGSIPVILADTWQVPGDPKLWAEACVMCEETPEAIAALPDMLAELAADRAALVKKRRVIQTLAQRYGPKKFVADILDLGLFPEGICSELQCE
ncbi:MAG: exostosin family protein [Erythrobacter sp.]|uniref:exostosin domain-containing protein n=1 Tax=Erythrobacter sp. TaxID=1042 RepID=UPI0032658854